MSEWGDFGQIGSRSITRHEANKSNRQGNHQLNGEHSRGGRLHSIWESAPSKLGRLLLTTRNEQERTARLLTTGRRLRAAGARCSLRPDAGRRRRRGRRRRKGERGRVGPWERGELRLLLLAAAADSISETFGRRSQDFGGSVNDENVFPARCADKRKEVGPGPNISFSCLGPNG